jgi:hypothetical protein
MFAVGRLARLRKLLRAIGFKKKRHRPYCRFQKELRKIKSAEIAAEFERFSAQHRQGVWDEVLGPTREARGEPNWRPTRLMEGLAFQAQVGKVLRERFKVAQTSPNKSG